MNLNSISAKLFLTATVVGLSIWLIDEHQTRLERVKEQEALKQQLQEMTNLVALNAELSNQLAQLRAPKPLPQDKLSELLRLRNEVNLQTHQLPDVDKIREENRHLHAVLEMSEAAETNTVATSNYWPRSSLTNSGYSSPEAALQTTFWAMNNGDVTNVFASITDAAQTNFVNEFKGKSDLETSIRMEDQAYGIEALRILGSEASDENTAVLTVGMDGQSDFQTGKLIMTRVAGEWKFAGPPR